MGLIYLDISKPAKQERYMPSQLISVIYANVLQWSAKFTNGKWVLRLASANIEGQQGGQIGSIRCACVLTALQCPATLLQTFCGGSLFWKFMCVLYLGLHVILCRWIQQDTVVGVLRRCHVAH